jgi:RHS repeat-associated protein
LYSGEQFDSKIGQQYLRQRYYDPATGLFNRLDPFFGNLNDPQSLHKYSYTHDDPVNGIDPNGLMTVASMVSSIGARVGTLGSNAAAAFNAYRSVRTFTDVIKLIKNIGLVLDRVHDTLNLIYDLIDFDLDDFRELKDMKSKLTGTPGSVLGASNITTPVIKISVPTGRGKLGRIFNALGRSKQISEFLGEIAAVGVAKAIGMKRVNIPVGYHGFDALMFEPISDRFVILEAKGNYSKLTGKQMRDSWITKNLNKLNTGDPEDIELLKKHKKELGQTKGMWAVVVKVYIHKGEFTIATQVKTYRGIKSWGKPFT